MSSTRTIKSTQLLCTFCSDESVFDGKIIKQIQAVYAPEALYIYRYTNEPKQYIITYNTTQSKQYTKIPNTIAIHRKKETNTLYSINALNEYIRHYNNNKLDFNFDVSWSSLKDSLILKRPGYFFAIIPLEYVCSI